MSLNADKDEATGTIEDDDGLTVSVAGPAVNVEEGQTATFTVTVTGTSTSEVVVSYEVDTTESTATSGDGLYGAAEPGGVDDRRWGGERDDRDSDEDGHGAGA